MIELEKTFLAKFLPTDLLSAPSKHVVDIYLPSTAHHPILRIRKNGDTYEITKKSPISGQDASRQREETISLTEEEYQELSTLPGKRVEKIRYQYSHDGVDYEIDVFQGTLEGLVLVDVEFDSIEKKQVFTMPDFCVADVTQESFIAGGMLCGKRYDDIEPMLKKFNYKKLTPLS